MYKTTLILDIAQGVGLIVLVVNDANTLTKYLTYLFHEY